MLSEKYQEVVHWNQERKSPHKRSVIYSVNILTSQQSHLDFSLPSASQYSFKNSVPPNGI